RKVDTVRNNQSNTTKIIKGKSAMGYNTKNYTEQGGEKTVIGGELVIEEGAKVTGLPSSSNEKMVNQSDSTAETVEDLVADFNALLSKLKTSDYMSDN